MLGGFPAINFEPPSRLLNRQPITQMIPVVPDHLFIMLISHDNEVNILPNSALCFAKVSFARVSIIIIFVVFCPRKQRLYVSH